MGEGVLVIVLQKNKTNRREIDEYYVYLCEVPSTFFFNALLVKLFLSTTNMFTFLPLETILTTEIQLSNK